MGLIARSRVCYRDVMLQVYMVGVKLIKTMLMTDEYFNLMLFPYLPKVNKLHTHVLKITA